MLVQRKSRAVVLGMALCVLTVALALVALHVGAASIPVEQSLSVIGRRLGLIDGSSVTVFEDQVVWQLRLPRVLGALAVGCCLAICGVVLQALTSNELADPYLLGISSGASVGAVTVIVFGVSLPAVALYAAIPTATFVGAIAATVIVLVLARGKSGYLPPGRTILAGVAVAQLCGAYTSLAILMFGERGTANTVLSWTLGSLAGIRWPHVALLAAVTVVALVVMLGASRVLDAFSFGEDAAATLGINVNRARWMLLIATSLITACTVAIAGPIGFVGLTVPHVVRLIVGPRHATLLPLSALTGAFLMVGADTLARTLRENTEIPIGVVTAVVGAPLLIYLLRRQAAQS
ncbi:iron ABC transporter permease [Corynebacterium diphtheriae bv. mitis]|uniref:Iron ABC transporter permease n=1 Tax=Corynebacterium diphtheriae bv. gravis TaxID=1720349 RepID=A0AAX0IZQ0_CORDP|nr:iron chelate uptake ABC transporter family permease subunit [Corynebacterium diphtheriae]ERA48668.1 vitamin B12 import system permease protein btuC [Corynebacterium diphtheriae DSM 43988]OWN10638.1 iron ABC transporter permease [Corynebacterium belfantii]AEX47444.1 iron chelate uptake ABC transporter permease protein [Corynebacterium diphtheriae INCA 402]AEX68468.1 vitamin B12 import system permease protein btuC [Corynebacterium diphtheriae C7 (beta)]AEX70917.1 vitamin B12 import system per